MEENNPEAKFSFKTDVAKHLLHNPELFIDFEHPEILASASSLKDLLMKETILIQRHRPDINFDDSSMPLYVSNNWFLLLIALLYFTRSGLLLSHFCQTFSFQSLFYTAVYWYVYFFPLFHFCVLVLSLAKLRMLIIFA